MIESSPNRIPYYSHVLARGESPNIEDYTDVVNILLSESLEQQIDQGKVTLAMIKPNVGPGANLLQLDDLEAADQIEEQITNLGVLAKFSFQFDEGAVDEFYEVPNKYNMLRQESSFPERFQNKWEQYRASILGGPVTVLLLHSEDGNAVQKLRAQLGHWDVETRRDRDSIRGRLGANNDNNLIHGSDSIDSVKTETWLIANSLQRKSSQLARREIDLLRREQQAGEWLYSIGILPSPDEPYGLKTNTPWKLATESAILDFSVVTRDGVIRLIEKTCIKPGSTEAMEEWMERRKIITNSGLQTPLLFAQRGATIIEEYIPYTFRDAYRAADESLKKIMLADLQKIIGSLFDAGFSPMSLHDLRSRGDDAVIIDFGFDLGASTQREITPFERALRAEKLIRSAL